MATAVGVRPFVNLYSVYTESCPPIFSSTEAVNFGPGANIHIWQHGLPSGVGFRGYGLVTCQLG